MRKDKGVREEGEREVEREKDLRISVFALPSLNLASHSSLTKARGRRYTDAGVMGSMCMPWTRAVALPKYAIM